MDWVPLAALGTTRGSSSPALQGNRAVLVGWEWLEGDYAKATRPNEKPPKGGFIIIRCVPLRPRACGVVPAYILQNSEVSQIRSKEL
jgi:hypothetical protein